MKIGILTYRQAPFISANTSIGYSIAKELSKEHEVCLIGYRQSNLQYTVEEYDGMSIKFLNKKVRSEHLRIQAVIKKSFGEKALYRHLSHGLNRIIDAERIDALIFVTAPSEDAWIVFGSNLKIPTYLLQLDPFYNLGDVINQNIKKDFLRLIYNVNHIFTTELLYDEYRTDSDMKNALSKMSVVQFPKLDVSRYHKKQNNNERPVLLYAGSLYHSIRNPSILVDIKRSVGNQCDVWFCGGCDCKEDETLLEQAGIVCFGYLQQDKLLEKTESADILINIGNMVRNQLGSKIVDYISTGKPILNIVQIDECPTIKVLEKYPLKQTLKSTELLNNSEEIVDFCKENSNKRVGADFILDNYREYTPSFVMRQISQKLLDNGD